MMVDMIQTDGPKLQVYIKMTHTQFVQALLRDTCGQAGYRHNNGEISIVNIDMVGMGTKKVWIPNLPPEVLEESLQSTLAPYGKVMIIQDQIWSRTYRYPVDNGIRQVKMTVTQHIPSHLTIAGHKVLISYEGQLLKFYGCGVIAHMYQACPKKKRRQKLTSKDQTAQKVTFAAHNTPTREEPQEDTAKRAPPIEQVSHTAQMIIDMDDSYLGNGHCRFETASNTNTHQGQHRTPKGSSSGTATTKRHRETMEPANATLVEDTTHNTPYRCPITCIVKIKDRKLQACPYKQQT